MPNRISPPSPEASIAAWLEYSFVTAIKFPLLLTGWEGEGGVIRFYTDALPKQPQTQIALTYFLGTKAGRRAQAIMTDDGLALEVER